MKPIIFSTPMVESILEGRKCMTRRIVKPQPDSRVTHFLYDYISWPKKPWVAKFKYASPSLGWEITDAYKCKYSIGDVLWVRETFRYLDFLCPEDRAYVYRADQNGKDWEENTENWYWKPSIFMPRAAARIFLEITDIGVERLQSISEEDAVREGAFFTYYGRTCYHTGMDGDISKCPAPDIYHPQKNGWSMVKNTSADECLGTARFALANQWNKINGPESWNSNPFVWVLTFKKVSNDY